MAKDLTTKLTLSATSKVSFTNMPDQHSDKIIIDLITDPSVSTPGNQHILTIIDHLTGWEKAVPILTKRQTLLSLFLSTIISQSACVPDSYHLTMEQNLRTN